MSSPASYEELLQQYQELQLRVTRFSAIEQELINTRDRLDNELVMYKRLHEFNVKALALQAEADFLALVAEYIIDIFEVEEAAIILYQPSVKKYQLIHEGLDIQEKDCTHFAQQLIAALPTPVTGNAQLLNKEEVKGLAFFKSYDAAIAYQYTDEDNHYQLTIAGLISTAKAPLYAALQERQRTIFGVFGQQVQALMTSRKKTEELKKINAELDNFVYSVSHDLRSPLLSIKGILSLVFNLEQIQPETAEYLQLAETSVERLDNTIQEILEYSRNARLHVKPEQFNVKELAEEIFKDIQFSTNLPVQFHAQIEADPMLYTDRSRLNTVLKNLISNAVKYRRKDIDNPEVHFSLFQQDDHWHIEVKDNGEGIPEDRLDKIFDMFYRGTKNSIGNGLGLYICKEIVEKLNGTITVESKPNEGTTMTLLLPKIKES